MAHKRLVITVTDLPEERAAHIVANTQGEVGEKQEAVMWIALYQHIRKSLKERYGEQILYEIDTENNH